MHGSLYVVDALNYLYRAFHALPPLTTRQGTPTGAIYGLCQMLLRIEREHRPTHICVVFDPPGKTFRDEIFAEYKAHRPPMPPDLAAQIPMVRQVVDAFGLPSLSVDGFEADDLIATLTRRARAAGLTVVICSGDKDLMQLIGDGVSLLDTMKNRMLGPAEVVEKFGVPPEKVGDVLALMGDSVDNVPGVEGIGPKTAAELVRTYGTIDDLLSRVGEVKGKRGEALARSRDAVLLSRRLVALRDDVPIPGTLEDVARREPDRERLFALFRELEFSRLLAQEMAAARQGGPDDSASAALAEVGAAQLPAAEGAHPPPESTSSPSAHLSEALDPGASGVGLEAPVRIVGDVGGLAELTAALAAAGSCGVIPFMDDANPARAELVGLAFALPSGGRWYVSIGHRVLGGTPGLREPSALAPVLADPGIAKALHDVKPFEVMLAFRDLRLGGVVWDTLLAGYLGDAAHADLTLAAQLAARKMGELPGREAWLGKGKHERSPASVPAEEAAKHLAAEASAVLALTAQQRTDLTRSTLLPLLEGVELPLCHVLARLERHGVRLDAHRLHALGEEVERSIRTLEEEIWSLSGGRFNIGSPKQLAQVLFEKLGLPVIRKTKTGPSTDADVLEELASQHAVPSKILEYRSLTKLKGTYIDALPALVNPRTGRLHTTFNQAVAATGRLSSSDPNLQNIPIRTELGRRIREAFTAEAGYEIVSADYSQIELRILAHFSADPVFLAAFRAGEDIHQHTAAEVFSVPISAVTAEQRRIAKAINFGLVFGQTDFGLAQSLRIPRATARSYIESYFQRYAGVRAYMERVIAEARRTGRVSTLLGRRRSLPEIASKRPQERSYAERIARNTPIQGSAADLLKLAMIRVDRGLRERWPMVRLLLTVHDELVFEVPSAEVTSFAPWVKGELESITIPGVELQVPLVVDVASGPTWGQSH
jgi:DNA polymerase-1